MSENDNHKNTNTKKKSQALYFFRIYVLPILIAIFIYFMFNMFVMTMVRVDGYSMQPNLQNNERVAVWRMAHIHHLSVIVFNAYGEDPHATSKKDYYVKRVIGMPGDTVSHIGNQIYVNGKPIKQHFIDNFQRGQGTGITEYQTNGNWNIHKLAPHWTSSRHSFKVPKNEYFVLGDHRSISNDSRYWGFVKKDKIMGVVKAMPWSTQKERNNVNDL